MAKKMTMKKWEGSAADKKMDRKSGLKEGSKSEQAADRTAMNMLKKSKAGKGFLSFTPKKKK